MIEEPPVLTIKKSMRRPNAHQIAAFQGVPTGFVVDALMGGGALASSIQSLLKGNLASTVAGPALTVDCGPADILATLASLNFIQTGDVVISSFAAHQGCAAAGDRVVGMIRNNGAVGFVTDGPVRDSEGIVAVGLPVWCTGLTPASPYTSGPGAVGFAIQIGGQEVETGDMIVADRDGVVVVPFERLDDVIEKLGHIREIELESDEKVANGLKIPDSMVKLLASDKVRYAD